MSTINKQWAEANIKYTNQYIHALPPAQYFTGY